MTRVQISLLILGIAILVKVIATQDFNHDQSLVDKFEEKISFLENAVFNLVKANKDITDTVINFEKRVKKLEEKNQILEEENKSLEKRNKDVNDELEYLRELSKLNTVR